jgi:hypothetical protein
MEGDAHLAIPFPSLDSPQSSSATQAVARRPRVGHKKSRSGCFTCKRRRIKCQENRPFCNNCVKIQVECRYPVPSKESTRGSPPILSIREIVQLQSTPTYFNHTDMRLFHHFLFNSYPHLPLGNEQVWVTELASLAHSVSAGTSYHGGSTFIVSSVIY